MAVSFLRGEMFETERAHPYNEEVYSSQLMRQLFRAEEDRICWWCGKRPLSQLSKSVQVDHIAPMVFDSPRAVVCSTCNSQRRDFLLDTEQKHRLLWDDRVVRDRSAEELRLWLSSASKEIFGSNPLGKDILLAKIPGRKVRIRVVGGRHGDCEVSNTVCDRLNIP